MELQQDKGINCRHDWRPYYEGSAKTYTDEQLEDIKSKKVTYNGKEMSVYEASQVQRKMERQIRVDKKKIAGRERLLAGVTTDKAEKELIAGLNYHKARLEIDKTNLNDLLKQTKLRQQYDRTVISAKGEYRTKSVVNYAKKLYNKNTVTENLTYFVSDEAIRKNIRKNKNYQKLKGTKQLAHLIDNEEYKEGKSYFEGVGLSELEEYIKKYSGTGRIVRKISDNSFANKEIVIIKDLEGININPTTKEKIMTHRFKIHYSKNGAHIVPTYEGND